jgi:hypothetical protein
MKLKLSLLALAAAMVTVLVVAPVAPAAKPAPPTNVTAPVTGAVAGGGTFTGTLSNIHFVNQNGTLAAVGNLTGTLTNAAGALIGNVAGVPITLPIGGAAATGSCQILDLTLGPLDLDLLGLQVHLNQVHLNITAQQGPGNLLGNLLCGVANLLNGPGGGGGLATLLNQLLGGLGL